MMLRRPLTYLFSDQCIDKIFIHYDFFDVPCLTAGLSKLLGYGVVVGSSIVKVPQILKFLGSRSAEGLSILSILFELFTFSTTLAYSQARGYPFSSYGESTFLAFQTFIIGWIAVAWEISYFAGGLFVGLYGVGMALLFSPMLPESVLYTLQALNIPIMLSSKCLQIFTNWRNRSTGQLSAITLCLFALGSTARIFTSIKETGDTIIILTFLLSTMCNYILMAQLFYYWRSPPSKKTGVSGKEKKQ